MSIWLRLVLITSVILSLSPSNRCEDEKPGIFDGITNPIKHIFESKEYEMENDVKEHGRLDSGARDLIRGLSTTVDRTIDKIEDTLGFKKSNDTSYSDRSPFARITDKFKEAVKAIYPGTKWCGDGNKAEDYDELGEFFKTDMCCREHDNCAISILAGETRFGLVNTGLFTRSHCDCDKKFYQCLKEANSLVSSQIGTTYFTVLGPQCFKKDFKIVKCAKTEWGKCIHYETTGQGESFYQWFDTPNF